MGDTVEHIGSLRAQMRWQEARERDILDDLASGRIDCHYTISLIDVGVYQPVGKLQFIEHCLRP